MLNNDSSSSFTLDKLTRLG